MSTLQLRAADGTTVSAYLVKPEGTPRGAVVELRYERLSMPRLLLMEGGQTIRAIKPC